MSEYTQGVCHGGAAILQDGQPLSMEQIFTALRERDEYHDHLADIAEMTGNAGDIGAAHEAVNALLEELARHKRMFAAACEQLGKIQQALGNAIVGIEPELVKELVEERDALAAHVESLKSALDNILSEVGTHSHDDLSDDERKALSALAATPSASLSHRDAHQRAEAFKAAIAAMDDHPQSARQMIEGMMIHCAREAKDHL